MRAQGRVLAQAADRLNLYRAWDAVRERASADGLPSRSLLAFAEHAEHNLDVIADHLAVGAYQPGALHAVRLARPGRDHRELGIPGVRDRVVERALHQALVGVLDPLFSPWSFAYRPGLGVADAVAALAAERDAGARFVARTDVADCFASLDQVVLLDALRSALGPGEAATVELVRRFLARVVRGAGGERRPSSGVPQGAPLSPLLCNLYLTALDERLAGAGVRAVRFADDLALPAIGRPSAEEAQRAVSRELGALGLRVNRHKSAISSFAEGVPFLGAEVSSLVPVVADRVEAPDRKVLYVTREGAAAHLHQGQLRVTARGAVVLSVPVRQVAHLVTFGNVGVSAGLRAHACLEGLEVAFLSRRGTWIGRLDSPRINDVGRRRQQYRCADDQAFALGLARSVVAGKLANQRALLQRYARREQASALAPLVDRLAASRRGALLAANAASLRGIEGAGARTYFEALARLLPPDCGFRRRVRRPPTDVVNSALGYGYSMLLSEVVGALAGVGLDPYVGFLHTGPSSGPRLALDLMEELRPLVVDTVVLGCFSRGILGPADGRSEGSRRGVLLKEPAKHRLIAAYETRMLTEFGHVPSGQRSTYRRALTLQARQVAALVDGRIAAYRPIAWR